MVRAFYFEAVERLKTSKETRSRATNQGAAVESCDDVAGRTDVANDGDAAAAVGDGWRRAGGLACGVDEARDDDADADVETHGAGVADVMRSRKRSSSCNRIVPDIIKPD